MTSGGARPLRPLPRIRRFGSVGHTGRALLCAGALAGGGWAAQAGPVQVEVADAAGKPLADAVVFLDSADARKLARPLATALQICSPTLAMAASTSASLYRQSASRMT